MVAQHESVTRKKNDRTHLKDRYSAKFVLRLRFVCAKFVQSEQSHRALLVECVPTFMETEPMHHAGRFVLVVGMLCCTACGGSGEQLLNLSRDAIQAIPHIAGATPTSGMSQLALTYADPTSPEAINALRSVSNFFRRECHHINVDNCPQRCHQGWQQWVLVDGAHRLGVPRRIARQSVLGFVVFEATLLPCRL